MASDQRSARFLRNRLQEHLQHVPGVGPIAEDAAGRFYVDVDALGRLSAPDVFATDGQTHFVGHQVFKMIRRDSEVESLYEQARSRPLLFCRAAAKSCGVITTDDVAHLARVA